MRLHFGSGLLFSFSSPPSCSTRLARAEQVLLASEKWIRSFFCAAYFPKDSRSCIDELLACTGCFDRTHGIGWG